MSSIRPRLRLLAPRSTASARLPVTPGDRRAVRSLLAWYRKSARDLPWRRTRDPYRIWISETMLQQTRVAAVVPYYERFLEALPTVRHLARAAEARVLSLWSGLGYYQRARNLRRAAAEIVSRHGGRIPDDETALGRLPGIGRYTRSALLSLCFDRPHPVVDGNVARVLSRWFAVAGDVRSTRVANRLWALAGALLPPGSAAEFNQAMMELGARVCTPRAPDCPSCPIVSVCRARRANRVEAFPARRVAPAPRRVTAAAAVVESPRGVLLVRRTCGENRGLLDLPSVEGAPARAGASILLRRLRALGAKVESLEGAGSVRHAVMDRVFAVSLFRGAAPARRLERGARWVQRSRLESTPLTARARRTLLSAREDQPRARTSRKKSVR
jgi:A/G-specific adenine glycosylase